VFISHDLAIVRHLSDRIAVMYLGTVVEEGPALQVYEAPAHPYTQALLASIASPAAERGERAQSRRPVGELPDPMNPPSGCPFRTRCWNAQDRCATEVPLPQPVGDRGRLVRCHFPETEQPRA
jgi:peptide/nickel transport system ATP-binding protein